MKWSTLLPLAISTFLLPSTGAWQITWTDADNQKHTQSGTGPSDCIVIDNPQGKLFRIDSQGENGINMLLFTNNECRGKPLGMATEVFSKDASQDLLGFKVVAFSATATTATASTGKLVPTVATTFPKTSPSETATASSSSSDINGSMTIQTTEATSAAATTTTATTSESSSTASSTTTSAASANTSNAAVSNGDMVKGLVGTIFGLGVVQWMI
jgi:hypothetical protein